MDLESSLATRAIMNYVQRAAHTRGAYFSTQPDRLYFVEKLIDSTRKEIQRIKDGAAFRYFMCAAIGTAFGVLCYYLLDAMFPEQQEQPEQQVAQQVECIACMLYPRSIIFSPCYHFVSCMSCSRKMVNCPMCRQFIERRDPIRTFLNQLE